MALATLVAGVNYNAQAIYLVPSTTARSADWSMNGGQNRNNEFLLDGAPNNANQGGNNIAYVPPPIPCGSQDAGENPTCALPAPAEGVVDMSLKSGTGRITAPPMSSPPQGLDATHSCSTPSTPKMDPTVDHYGVEIDGPMVFLLVQRATTTSHVQRRAVPEGAPAAQFGACRLRR